MNSNKEVIIMTHKAVAIANYFIERSDHKGLTLMQILKLSYLAHGFTLALLDRPLANEFVQAWKFGPVFPTIYHEFKSAGERVKRLGTELNGDILVPVKGSFSEKEGRIMDMTFDSYGGLKGWQLSVLTHKEGTPWYVAWHEEGGKDYYGFSIDNEKIKNHFKNIIK